ncbi:MAG: hypothetical protein IJZ45_08675 [Bacteroidaceae bacterium]|nr:hypothetical protein [Bacteroidaceae bacterium]
MIKKLLSASLFAFVALAANAYEIGEFAYTKVAKYKITGENLVVNGKFTEGDTGFGAGWVATDAANAPLESVFTMVTGGPNGSNTQKVIDGQTDMTKGMYQKIAVSAGGTYVVSFQVLGTTAAFTDLDMTGGNTNYMAAYYNTDAKDSLATVNGTNLYYGTNGVCGAYQFSFGTTFTPVAFAVEAPAEGYIIIDFRGLNAGVEIADVECHLAENVYDDRIARDRIAYFQKYLVSEGIAERDFYEDFELAVADVEAGLEAGESPEKMAELMENLELVWTEFTAVNFENMMNIIPTKDGSANTGNNSANWMNWTAKWNKLSNDYNGKAPWSWTTDRWCHKTAAADSPMAIQWMRGAGANGNWNNIATLTATLNPGTYYWGVSGQGGMMTLNKNRWARSWADECAETKLFFNGDTILVGILNAARNEDYVLEFKLDEQKEITLGIICNNVSTSENAGFDVQFYSPVLFKLIDPDELTEAQKAYIAGFLKQLDALAGRIEFANAYVSAANDTLPWGKEALKAGAEEAQARYNEWAALDTAAILETMDLEQVLADTVMNNGVRFLNNNYITPFEAMNKPLTDMPGAIAAAEETLDVRMYSSSSKRTELKASIAASKAMYAEKLQVAFSSEDSLALITQRESMAAMVETFKAAIDSKTIVDIDFNGATVVEHTDPEGLIETYYTLEGAKGTMVLSNYANGATGTTQFELGVNGTDSLNMLRVGNGSATVDFTGVPVTDQDIVKIQFDLYCGNLSGKKNGYKLLTAEGDTICGINFSKYSGNDDLNTFGVDYNGKISAVGSSSASNAAIAAESNKTSFEIVLDFGLKTMYCVTSGSKGTATTEAIALPEGKIPAQFVIYSDYNNADRRSWFDNFKVLNIATDPNGIEAIQIAKPVANGIMYNIMGQQILKPIKGQIYIQNGVKKIGK